MYTNSTTRALKYGTDGGTRTLKTRILSPIRIPIPSHPLSNLVLTLDQIQQVHVELTTRCNARCPMCLRNFRGVEYNSGYPITELTLEQFTKILTPAILQQLSRGVNFNGNLGDFGLARDAVAIVNFLIENQVPVHINTNGSIRSADWWQQLAQPKVSIAWALDGLADTHNLHRQDTDWYRVIEHATAFINAGGRAIWKFIKFNHNQHQIDQCRNMARELGFAAFDLVDQGRNRSPVFTRTGEFTHWIGEPWTDNTPAVEPMLESLVTWYDAKTIKHAQDTTPLNLNCVHLATKEIYLAADGTVYPCCFLGFYPTTMQHADNNHIRELVHENNALEYGLEHAMHWFTKVEQTWKQPSIAQGRLYTCVNSCASRSNGGRVQPL